MDSREELKGEGEDETQAVCDAYRHPNNALLRKILHHAVHGIDSITTR